MSKKLQIETVHPKDWSRDSLRSWLVAMRKKRVLVVGDVGIDRYTIGSVERISPEAPVPIVRVESEQLKLGLAANVADNIQAVGGVSLIVGVIGKDDGAKQLKALFKAGKISAAHLVVDSSRRTVLKERVVSDRQQLLRIDYESQHAITASVEAQILHQLDLALSTVGAVIVEDYAKGLLSQSLLERIFKKARAKKVFVAVDPNVKTPVGFYRGAALLTPNTKEAEALVGYKIHDQESLLRAGAGILSKTGACNVVITRGREGMAIFTLGSRKVTLIPTYAREVFDVSGAGDTVIAVMTLALSAGASVEESAILANLAAGVEVGKRGTATVSPEEILLALEFFGSVAV